MKIKIKRTTICQKRIVYEGQTLDVPKDEAILLIGAQKAVALGESPVEKRDVKAQSKKDEE